MNVALEESPMAKTKSTTKRAGRPPVTDGPKKQILGIRGSDEYKEWLARFATAQRSDMVDLVDDALAAYAKAMGFDAPPKR